MDLEWTEPGRCFYLDSGHRRIDTHNLFYFSRQYSRDTSAVFSASEEIMVGFFLSVRAFFFLSPPLYLDKETA